MSNAARTGDLPIEIIADSFPIIGGCTPEMRAKINQERLVAGNDLSDTRVLVSVSYDDPIEFNPEICNPEKTLEIEKVIIRREEAKIFFEAIGDIYIVDKDQPGYYHPSNQKIVLAQSKVSIAPLLRIARMYLGVTGQNEQIVRDFIAAGDKGRAIKLDADRRALHSDVARALQTLLKGQNVRFKNGECSDSEFAELGYLVTAILMHILPASAFENEGFLKEKIRPKYDLRTTRYSDFNS